MRKAQVKLQAGKTYGVITVVSVSKESTTHSVKTWCCKCEKCTKMFEYTGCQVLKYQDQGCPQCRNKLKVEERIKQTNLYSGAVYGNLKIIKFDHFDKKNMPVVQCKCLNCGNDCYISLTKIKHGESKQCFECCKKNLKKGDEILSMAYINQTYVVAIDGRRKTNKNSTTKITGVSYFEKHGKYRAYINFQKRQYYLGLYENLEDAIKARKEAEEKIYGDFLEWYRGAHPELWSKIKKDAL